VEPGVEEDLMSIRERRSIVALIAVMLGSPAIAAAGQGSPGLVGAEASSPVVVTQLVDRAETAGLPPLFNNTWAAEPVDFDNDGDEDVWIGYHQQGVLKEPMGAGRLFRNDGDGTYTWVAREAWPRLKPNGRIPDRHDCTFSDFDHNGFVDSYCSAGRNQSNLVKNGIENELWLQESAGSFSDRGVAWGVGDVCGRGRFVTSLDANGDGWSDIFLGNEVPRNVADPCDNPANGYPNEESKLYLNNADGTGFTYAPELVRFGARPGQRCAETLDFDQDGWDDLLLCRLKGQPALLYHNDGGTAFSLMSAASSGLNTAAADETVADVNGDGLPDVVGAHGGYFSYQLNTGNASPRFASPVRILSIPAGEGRSVAVADADGDQDLDVFAMIGNGSQSGNPTDQLLINDGHLDFSAIPAPNAGGQADEVIALEPVAGSPAQFLALNGGGKAGGPIQLIVADVSIPGPNVPPVAAFSVDCSGARCSFDGSGSSDPDGSIVGYGWDFGDGAGGVGRTVEHTYGSDGVFEVTLTVTDSRGDSDSVVSSVAVVNQVPVADFSVSCQGLSCVLDGSASSDGDGSIVSYEWVLGDGSTSTGRQTSHSYAGEGVYSVMLRVTDDRAAVGEIRKDVSVLLSSTSTEFVAAEAVGGPSSSMPGVNVPFSVEGGDTLLLFVSNGSSRTPAVPGGWALLGTEVDNELRTDVYWRLATDGDAGQPITVALLNSSGVPQSAPNTVTVAAYSGVASPPVSVFASDVELSRSYVGEHTTPGVTVPADGSWVVSYWADRTSNTSQQSATSSWTAPVGQQLRADAYNTVSGGRVTSLLTDDGSASPAGPRQGLTATANGQTRKATLWTIVLEGA
jgi:PKD repeat protein